MTEPLTLSSLLGTLQEIVEGGATPAPTASSAAVKSKNLPQRPEALCLLTPQEDPSPTVVALQSLLLDLTEQMVTALAEAIEARDPFTGGHCKRLAATCLGAAEHMGLELAGQHRLRLAAYMHDVGKISVPDSILKKPGPLTPDEYVEMQRHPTSGAVLLQRMPLLAEIAPIVAAHHERFDGRGYPNGLCGDAIPLEASILSVADCFDALTHDRPYRKAQPVELAVNEIRAGRGSQFHPLAVDAFIGSLQRTAGRTARIAS